MNLKRFDEKTNKGYDYNDFYENKGGFTAPPIKGASDQAYYDRNTQGIQGGLKGPAYDQEYRSEMSRSGSYYAGVGNGIMKSDSFYDRVAVPGGPLYKRMPIDTPQSDANNYLNWVQPKEKFSLKDPKSISMKLSPLRAGAKSLLDNDGISRTNLKARDAFNKSQIDEIRANMSIDGYSVNGDRKPRAFS